MSSAVCSFASKIEECHKRIYTVNIVRLKDSDIQQHLSIRDDIWWESHKINIVKQKNILSNVDKLKKPVRSRKCFGKKKRSYSDSDDYLSEEYYENAFYNKKKKKKVPYEEDFEWSPSLDNHDNFSNSKQKRSEKSLRLKTRRRRIESYSSSSNDSLCYFGDEYADYYCEPSELQKTTDSFDCTIRNKKEETFQDNEVFKIMQEMKNFSEQNKRRPIKTKKKSWFSGEQTVSKIRVKKTRKLFSRPAGVTDEQKNIVQGLIKEMVTKICSIQKQYQNDIIKGKMTKCKWCATFFLPKSANNSYCDICHDQKKASCNKKPVGVKNKVIKNKTKTFNKIIKNLSKYDQLRLMYAEKTNVDRPNVCQKDSSSNQLPNLKIPIHKSKPVKVTQTKDTIKNTLQPSKINKPTRIRKKTQIMYDNIQQQITKPQSLFKTHAKSHNQKHVTVSNVMPGILSISYPDPDIELELSQKKKSSDYKENESATTTQCNTKNISTLPSNKNVKYSTLSLPPLATLIVSNYSGTGGNSEVYLSSLYYQNEFTNSKPTSVGNNNSGTVIAANSVLPSMPSIQQISGTIENLSCTMPSSIISSSRPATNIFVDPKVNFKNSSSAHSSNNKEPGENQTLNSLLTPEHGLLSICSSEQTSNGLSGDAELKDNTADTLSVNEKPLVTNLSKKNFNLSFVSEANISDTENYSLFENLSENDLLDQPLENVNDLTFMEIENTVLENIDNLRESISLKYNHDSTLPSISKQVPESVKAPPVNLISQTVQEIEAIALLSILDINSMAPKKLLNIKSDDAKKKLSKLEISDNLNEEDKNEKISLLGYLELCDVARGLLHKFGSFKNLSEYYLRKEILMKVKMESLEKENLSSCQFSQESLVNNSFSMESTDIPQQSISVNHLNELQAKINEIPKNSVISDDFSLNSISHPALPETFQTVLPALITQRSDSRETPSRGSGPVTPSRPESALSHQEEPILTPLEIKKELLEAQSPSICTFSQNAPSLPPSDVALAKSTILPHSVIPHSISSSVIETSCNAQLNVHPISTSQTHKTPHSLFVTNTNSVMNPPNSVLHGVLCQPQAPPNITAPNDTNQQLSRLLMEIQHNNVNTHSNNNVNTISNLNVTNENSSVVVRNNNIVNVQHVYFPPNRFPHQTHRINLIRPVTSSVNSNQIIFQQNPISSANTLGGTMLVNNLQTTGQHNMYSVPAALNNTQQITDVYSSSNYQQNIQSHFTSLNSSQLMPHNNQQVSTETEPSICALCGKPATLRCKQCARVAYCNTQCAKTYWHSKHKMECRAINTR